MNIPNNVLKHYLKNAYLFCGTTCGGKSTISKTFAEKHNLLLLDEESLDPSTPENINANFHTDTDWNKYFNRPYKEYYATLQANLQEKLPETLIKIIRASVNQPVVADVINMPISKAMELTERNRIVFLVTTPEIVMRDFHNRPSHKAILDCIMSTKNPNESLANDKRMLAYSTELYLEELRKTDLFYIMRGDDSAIESTLAKVEKHFGFI